MEYHDNILKKYTSKIDLTKKPQFSVIDEVENINQLAIQQPRMKFLKRNCDCLYDQNFIEKCVFSRNAAFFLVIGISLDCWIINTVTWNVYKNLDFDKIISNSVVESQYTVR